MPHLVTHAAAPSANTESSDSEPSQRKQELQDLYDDRKEGSELLLSLALTASQAQPVDVNKKILPTVEESTNALGNPSSSLLVVTPLRNMCSDLPLPVTRLSQDVQSDTGTSSPYFEHARVGHHGMSEPTKKECYATKEGSELDSVNSQATGSTGTTIVTPHSKNRKKKKHLGSKLYNDSLQHRPPSLQQQVTPHYLEMFSQPQLPWHSPHSSSHSRFSVYSPQTSKFGPPMETPPLRRHSNHRTSPVSRIYSATYLSSETGTPGPFQISTDRRSPSGGSPCSRRSNERSSPSRYASFVTPGPAHLRYESGIPVCRSPPGPLRLHTEHATHVPEEASRYNENTSIHQYHPFYTTTKYPPTYSSPRKMPSFRPSRQKLSIPSSVASTEQMLGGAVDPSVGTQSEQDFTQDQESCREKNENYQKQPAKSVVDAKKDKSQDSNVTMSNKRHYLSNGDCVADSDDFEKKKRIVSLNAPESTVSNRFYQMPVVQSQIRGQRLRTLSHQSAVSNAHENRNGPRRMHEPVRAHQFRGMTQVGHSPPYAHHPGAPCPLPHMHHSVGPCSPPHMHHPGHSGAMWWQGHVQQDYHSMRPPAESSSSLGYTERLPPSVRAVGARGPSLYSGNPTHAIGVSDGSSHHRAPPPHNLLSKPDQSKPKEKKKPVIQESTIKSVAQWQAALAANNGVAPSTNRCVPLKPPIPSRFWGDMEKMNDAFIPDFHRIVNFPDYLPKNRPPPGAAGNDDDNPNGMKRCVMCGEERLCTTSASSTTGGGRSKTQTQKIDSPMSIAQGGLTCFSENGAVPIIPRQNKGLCTDCDVTVWVITQSKIEIKWCKGCKNFRPWAAFGDKGHATKCVRCRDRQREKYLSQKDDQMKKKWKSLNKNGGDEEIVINARKDIYKVFGVRASEEKDEERETGCE